jgi:predicted alpha/beta-fold hydrolase
MELPDGDFVDLFWVGTGEGPVVLVLHGLEGGYTSPYAAAVLAHIAGRGWRAVLMHFRGCSGELNRLPRSYHSGDTGDLGHVLEQLRERLPDTPFAAIGYSIGGNVLLKFLGEQGTRHPLSTAIAISVPFDLAIGATRLNSGFSRVYQRRLLNNLRAKVRLKFDRIEAPIDLTALDQLRSFWAFDDKVTAPLHGFEDVHDYYKRSSCRHYLRHIRTPTLILHALDDPFMTTQAVPNTRELSSSVRLELSTRGGHVGFVSGSIPGVARYWLDRRIIGHLSEFLPLWGDSESIDGYNSHPASRHPTDTP